MTLRLVSDNHEPDGTQYCRHGVCEYDPRRARPATVLITFCDKPPLPSCDECARTTWENHANSTRLSPLSGYVDMFEAAKQAALATPEQVIQQASEPIRGSDAVDDPVLRRIWTDQKIYCRLHRCEIQHKLTPASQRLNAIGGLWYPACADCITRYDPAQVEVVPMSEEVEVVPMSEENVAWELQMAAEYAASKHWTKPGAPHPATVCILLAAPVISLLGGSFMGSQAGGSFLLGLGVFIVLLPITIGIGFLAKALITDIKDETRQNAAMRQQGYAPQQGYAGPWYTNPDVVNAALVGGVAIAAHEAHKRRQARLTASVMGTDQRHIEQNQRLANSAAGYGYRTNDQIGLGKLAPRNQLRQQKAQPRAHTFSGSLTPNSDIYGNVRYRDGHGGWEYRP